MSIDTHKKIAIARPARAEDFISGASDAGVSAESRKIGPPGVGTYSSVAGGDSSCGGRVTNYSVGTEEADLSDKEYCNHNDERNAHEAPGFFDGDKSPRDPETFYPTQEGNLMALELSPENHPASENVVLEPPAGTTQRVAPGAEGEQVGVGDAVSDPPWIAAINASLAKKAALREQREAEDAAQARALKEEREREQEAREKTREDLNGTGADAHGAENQEDGDARDHALRQQQVLENYINTALSNAEDELASAPGGTRNEVLYRKALKLGSFIAKYKLDESAIRRRLLAACVKNGLVKDDGQRAVVASINSGLRNGKKNPHHAGEPTKGAWDPEGSGSGSGFDLDFDKVNNPDNWAPEFQYLNNKFLAGEGPVDSGTRSTGEMASPGSSTSRATPPARSAPPVPKGNPTGLLAAPQGAPAPAPASAGSGAGAGAGSGAGGAGSGYEFPQEFFDQSDVLKHIQTYAHANACSAPSVLTLVLARVLLEAGPGITIPPMIGAPASLNLGFNLTGKSGFGKSTTFTASEKLLGVQQGVLERNLGSGEGMIDEYLDFPVKGAASTGVVIPDPRRLFSVDEIEKLSKLAERSGSTIGSDIRSGLTGGSLGTANAKAGGRSRHLPRGSYRLVIVASVQPTAAGFLLEGEGTGLPQRFLWVGLADPGIPEILPANPGSLGWTSPWPILGAGNEYHVPVDPEIQEWIRSSHVKTVRSGDSEESRSHINLTRLKVALALAALHGEVEISSRWWEMAEHLTEHSIKVQDYCRELIADEASTRNKRQAVARGHSASITAQVQERVDIENTCNRVLVLLERAGSDGATRREIFTKLSRAQRQHTDQAVSALLDASRISKTETGGSASTGGTGGQRVTRYFRTT